MVAAIENMAAMKVVKRVLILGDMYELEAPEQEHRAIGKLIKEKEISDVYLVGKFFQVGFGRIPGAKYFETKLLLIEELKRNPIRDSTL